MVLGTGLALFVVLPFDPSLDSITSSVDEFRFPSRLVIASFRTFALSPLSVAVLGDCTEAVVSEATGNLRGEGVTLDGTLPSRTGDVTGRFSVDARLVDKDGFRGEREGVVGRIEVGKVTDGLRGEVVRASLTGSSRRPLDFHSELRPSSDSDFELWVVSPEDVTTGSLPFAFVISMIGPFSPALLFSFRLSWRRGATR